MHSLRTDRNCQRKQFVIYKGERLKDGSGAALARILKQVFIK
jgi:hypothetical protein